MSNLTQTLVHLLGADIVLPVAETIVVSELSEKTRPQVVRAIEIPESVIDQLCQKTGASKAEVMDKRAALGEAFADFVFSFSPTGNGFVPKGNG